MHLVHDPSAPAADATDFNTFLRLDIRAGTIVSADPFPEARKPAYKLRIDFGAGIGVRASSAQITELYRPEDLEGMRVAALVNVPPRRIGPFLSEVLTLGFPDTQGRIVLMTPGDSVPDGARLS
ncbi:MAG: tRNA-binding protein [Alphaproteobacteria bacterium]